MTGLQLAARDATLAAFVLYGAGCMAALVAPGRRGAARAGLWVGALAGLAAIVSAALVWRGGGFDQPLVYWYGFGHAGLRLDPFAALFVLIVGGVGLPICVCAPDYLDRYGRRYSPRAFAVLLNLLLASVLLTVAADNVFLFLVGWELIALLFYLLIAYEYDQEPAPVAAYLTAAMTRVSGALVIAAYLLLAAAAHSFSLDRVAAAASTLPLGLRIAIFVLALIGFGVKLGAVPVQIWLPPGYRAAPSVASAAMAGVALNAGFYGLMRVLFTYLTPLPDWCGLVVLLVGGITAVLGILYGAVQGDLKVFIAYSSVENVGIILIGTGLAVLARAQGVLPLAGLALLAALYHLLGHAVAKALLFLGAGSVEVGTGTTDMERLGGLNTRMRWTATTFLLGALALAALPPFSGFSSEWLTLQALMQGFRLQGAVGHVMVALVGALLALTSGLALLAFVKVVGITFLGQARATESAAAHESPLTLRAALSALALCSVALGVLAPWVVRLLGASSTPLVGLDVAGRVVGDRLIIAPAYPHFSSADPSYLAIVLSLFVLIPLAVVLVARWRWGAVAAAGMGRQPRRLPAWASGSGATGPRIEYSAIGYSNPVRVIFTNIYRTGRELTASGPDLFPHVLRYRSQILPAAERLLYQPLVTVTLAIADAVRRLQNGYLSAYIAYILIVLLIALAIFAGRT